MYNYIDSILIERSSLELDDQFSARFFFKGFFFELWAVEEGAADSARTSYSISQLLCGQLSPRSVPELVREFAAR